MLSPPRITLENNGKIRPQPDVENAFAGPLGGGDGTGIGRSPKKSNNYNDILAPWGSKRCADMAALEGVLRRVAGAQRTSAASLSNLGSAALVSTLVETTHELYFYR